MRASVCLFVRHCATKSGSVFVGGNSRIPLEKTAQDLGMHEGGACEGRIAGLSANMSLEGSVRERG